MQCTSNTFLNRRLEENRTSFFLLLMSLFFVVSLMMATLPGSANAQSSQDGESEREVKPGMAMLRSAVMPGWGHHYVKPDQWGRGKFHIIAEGVLLLTYIGFDIRSSHLDDRMVTSAKLSADTDLDAHGRNYEIAVGKYNSLEAYNESQLELRNWSDIYPENDAYRWNWETERKRDQYLDLRNSRDRLERQLPGLLSLMVVNRIISGISAYNWARELNSEGVEHNEDGYFSEQSTMSRIRQNTTLRFLPADLAEPAIPNLSGSGKGILARLKYRF